MLKKYFIKRVERGLRCVHMFERHIICNFIAFNHDSICPWCEHTTQQSENDAAENVWFDLVFMKLICSKLLSNSAPSTYNWY